MYVGTRHHLLVLCVENKDTVYSVGYVLARKNLAIDCHQQLTETNKRINKKVKRPQLVCCKVSIYNKLESICLWKLRILAYSLTVLRFLIPVETYILVALTLQYV